MSSTEALSLPVLLEIAQSEWDFRHFQLKIVIASLCAHCARTTVDMRPFGMSHTMPFSHERIGRIDLAMKVHAICIIKDEADIIAQTLQAAVEWCDFVYILDNGSTDGTWEAICRLSKQYAQLVPYMQDGSRPFTNSVRGELYNHFRDNSAPGDWWVRLDADEIYIDDPRAFLANVPERYGSVYAAVFQYYFTDVDRARYETDPSSYAPNIPIQDKLRYYLNNLSTLRMIRDNGHLAWKDRSWPRHRDPNLPTRIWLRHYQYRSPQQIQRRLNVRYQNMRRGGDRFPHEKNVDWHAAIVAGSPSAQREERRSGCPSWEDRVVPSEGLYDDRHDGHYVLREDLMAPVTQYTPAGKFYARLTRLLTRHRRA